MKQSVHDNPCANPQEATVRNAPHRAPNVFAAKAAAFMLSFSYACSVFTPQEPVAPARTARISSDQGKVGQWSFRRFGDSGYEFMNEDFGTSIFVGRSMVTIRRPSPSGGLVESNLSLGDINIESVGASSPQSALTLTFPTLSGEVFEITLSPGGENPDVRAFVRE